MNFQNFADSYIDDFHKAMDKMDKKPFDKFCKLMLEAYEEERSIFIMGNGGSAATASHALCDINKGACLELEKKFRLISLADNLALITAIANDLDYSQIFVEQLKNHMKAKDIVLAISGSGNSENIIKAIDYAKKKGAISIGISGFDGGLLAELADLALVIPIHDMQKVEDGQMMILHMLMQAMRKALGLKNYNC